MSGIERNFVFLASVGRSKASRQVLGYECYELLPHWIGPELDHRSLFRSPIPTADLIEMQEHVIGTVTYSLEIWKIT